MRRNQLTILVSSLAILLSACTNSGLKKLAQSASNVGNNGAGNVIVNSGTFTIASVSVGSSASSSDSSFPMTLTFNTATSPSMLDSCTDDQGNYPCLCKFKWNETNNSTGNAITIAHQIFTNVTSAQKAAVQCATPPHWDTEIPDNTPITISVVPAVAPPKVNPNQFTVTPYGYTKGQVTETGNFSDNMGRSFVNILRYSCYEQRKRGLTIMNKIGSFTAGSTYPYVMANQFCLRGSDGSIKGGSGCESLPAADFTAQSYYYNMFIRDSESGDANEGNAVFVCPKVTEALNQQSGNPGTQGKFWPMDSSFALSLGKTSDFSVGIVAHTKATNTGDPSAKNTTCDSSSPGTAGTANSLISSCLGFAAKPNVDGTCPKLNMDKVSGVCPSGTIASGSNCILPTYRLRRFVAIYPSYYNTDGSFVAENQRTDMVYVLDRPVLDASGNIDLDPNGSPYSMLGPKPCPFAFFDTNNVTGSGVGYHGTNHAGWSDKNVDDLYFPNQTTGAGASGTCTAILPKTLNSPPTQMTIASVPASKLYIRPIKAWSPHYEEDKGFQACAPQSNPLRDPPLHFAMSGTNMSWCAEVYPTNNDNTSKLPAGATHSTSHSDASCAGGVCHRTVVDPANGIAWAKFPLLAPEAEVTSALQKDASFGCAMTYDNGGGKVNSADFSAGSTPTQGCCSNVPAPGGGGQHLEPTAAPVATPAVYTQSCTPPKY